MQGSLSKEAEGVTAMSEVLFRETEHLLKQSKEKTASLSNGQEPRWGGRRRELAVSGAAPRSSAATREPFKSRTEASYQLPLRLLPG